MFLRQSTAQTVRIGPFIDDTDFVSEEVALTISAADIRLSKDGGNMVSCSVGATHDEVGYYSVALGTGDTNTVGMLDVMVSETGTLWVKDRFYVLEEAVYDAMFGASAALNVGTAASVTGAVASVTGNVGGNVVGTVASVVGAVGSVTGAVASVSGNVDGNVTGSVASVIAAVSTTLTTAEKIDLYEGGAWYKSTGAAGTVIGTNGTPGNPCSAFADAVTLAGTTGLNRVYAFAESVATATIPDMELVGVGGRPYFIANAQVCTLLRCKNIEVFGPFGAASQVYADDCLLGGSTGWWVQARNCFISGTTAFAAGDSRLSNTVGAAGGTTIFDLGVNASNLELAGWSGEAKLTNMDATNSVVVDGIGVITIDSSCTGGTVTIRGQISLTDNSGGAVTVIHVTGVNLTQINGETAPLTKFQAILDTTISGVITSGGGSTTSFDSTSIPTTNDGQLVDKVGVFTDGPAKFRGFVVRSYTDATKTLVVDTLNVAPATGNAFLIFA